MRDNLMELIRMKTVLTSYCTSRGTLRKSIVRWI